MDWFEALRDKASDVADQAGRIRYGVPTSEKERLARTGSLPGAPSGADAETADRYAAGYLTTRQHPSLYPAIAPYIDATKTSAPADILGALLGGDTPTVQSYATSGMNQALLDRSNAELRPKAALQADALRPSPRPQPSYNPPYGGR